ncbi:MAG: rRNA pseudouridine synthase [bacterium]|nr:rRNA pseudouridine synthase [bacterium]
MSRLKLQKAIQTAGFDSRRNIRKWIGEGEFKVNNTVVTDPNFLVDLSKDTVRYQDKKIKLKIEKKAYYLFNKPYGVVSTLSDPEERPTITDFISKIKERVYPVGRLDYHSEGLILLTNDGELTNFIISARNKIPKVYNVKIKGILKDEERRKMLAKGVFLEGVRVKPLKIDYIRKTHSGNSWIRLTINEGKKHIVRKFFKYSGHPVEKLKRVSIGSFKLGKLPSGHIIKLVDKDLDTFCTLYNWEMG